MKPTYILHTILALASLFLTSCGLASPSELPVAVSPTSPAVNAATSIFVTPSPPDQPPQTPTLMPIPTLSDEDALETFVNLIKNDRGCNLPCWLGVTPGQTRFEEVENAFSRFSAIASTKFSSHSAFLRVFFPNFETATHDTATEINPAEDGKVYRILVYAVAYQNINGPANYTSPEFQSLWQRYFIPGIFSSHGVPEKIFLDTTLIAADTATSYPFVLWIVYPEQGFLIRYTGNNSKIGENIRICPIQSRIEIKIWDVEKSSYEEFIKDDRALGISTSLGPQPIESVTDFEVLTFYETFRRGAINTCFETPASIWPH